MQKNSMDMEETSNQARQYSKLKTQLIVYQLLLTAAFLITMLFSGASLFLKALVIGLSRNFYLQLGFYLVIFSGIYYLLFIGLDFYSSFLLEHKFKLSNQTILGWLKQSIKKGLLSLLMLLAAAEAFYFLLRNFQNNWWLPATALWLMLTITLAKITPILIIPLFYKCRPLVNRELKENLIRLSKNHGVRIKEVFEVQLSKDTKKANAAVVGFGKGRRILLGDTLLENYSDQEIEAIFAHELGHLCLLHTWKIFAFGTVISLASFYLTFLLLKTSLTFFGFNQIYDIAAFALLALILMLLGLLFMPIQNSFLRHLEKNADMFALDHIQNKQSFIAAIKKLANQNLSDPSPGKFAEFLLYTHPPISKRLHYAGEKSEKCPEQRHTAKDFN